MFSEKSDVWSYDVTLFEVLTLGAVPYSDMETPKSLRSFILLLKSGYKLACPQRHHVICKYYCLLHRKQKTAPSVLQLLGTFSYCSRADVMESCLAYNSPDRPTFAEIRTKLQHYVDGEYNLRLDDAYNTFNELFEAGLESESQQNNAEAINSGAA